MNEVSKMMRMTEVMLIAGATALGFGMATDPKMQRKAKRMSRKMKRKLHF